MEECQRADQPLSYVKHKKPDEWSSKCRFAMHFLRRTGRVLDFIYTMLNKEVFGRGNKHSHVHSKLIRVFLGGNFMCKGVPDAIAANGRWKVTGHYCRHWPLSQNPWKRIHKV